MRVCKVCCFYRFLLRTYLFYVRTINVVRQIKTNFVPMAITINFLTLATFSTINRFLILILESAVVFSGIILFNNKYIFVVMR